jgi:hypothetical protein
MKRSLCTATFSCFAVMALFPVAKADVIAYQRMPLANVISRLNQRFHINIVLKGQIARQPNRLVSFSVGTSDQDTTRVQAVAALANAANVDFQKGFVVSKIPADEAVPDVAIDTGGHVVFQNKTMSAAEAIKIVAATDDATSQVAADVTGKVTFTDTVLLASDAAKQIAQQTHTVWRVYYALMPDDLMAVTPHPNLNFDITLPPPTDNNDTADNTEPGAPGAPGTAVNPQTGAQTPYQYSPSMTSPYGYGASPYGYGSSPYGYGYGASPYGYGYGSSPYGYGGYGSSPYGYGGIGVFPSTGGYGPFGGYGGPPVTF